MSLRIVPVLLLLATQFSCFGAFTVADLRLFKDLNYSYSSDSSIKIFVSPEQDYASYFEKANQFNLQSIRQELISRLSKNTIAATKIEFNQSISETELPNPFTVTDDEQQANLSIQIIVDVFEYGDARTVGEKMILGLLGSGDQAVMIGSYKIIDQAAQKQLFGKDDVRVLSGEGMVPRKALEKANLDFSTIIYQDLVRIKY